VMFTTAGRTAFATSGNPGAISVPDGVT